MFDCRVRAFLWALWLASMGIAVFGQEHRVTLKGKLFATGDTECEFSIDPEDGSEEIWFRSKGYLCDYWKGTEARPFIITMGPTDK